MRHFVAGAVLPLFAVVPLSAQFEGTVTMNVPSSKEVTEMTYYLKGMQVAASIPVKSGQMAGQTMRMIWDLPAHKMTMLIPMAMGNAKGIKSVVDMNTAMDGKENNTDVKPLGTSETIAGYKCDDYEIVENGKANSRMCVTHELGFFAYAAMSGPGPAAAAPAWAKAFGNKPMFPLKVSNSEGKVVMEATAVHREPVSADMFAIPDGYMDMNGMGSMMGGRGPGKP
ncbi:MAG: DUF4412 domain-containing protein [Gemmatimonadales bacterium]